MLPGPATWLDRLAAYRVPLTPRAALDYLSQQSARCGILGCYRLFFPDQWAASCAPLLPAADQAYSAREWEFFRLADAHLFPLDLFWLDDLDDDPANRTLTIPLTPLGLDWWDASPDDFRPGIQILLVLAGAVAPHETTLAPPQVAALQAARAGQGTPLGLPAAAGRRAPLAALPHAYAWIHQDTGNAWLDATGETPIDVEWNRADVAWCAAEYREARAIEADIAPLITWFEAAPAHLLEVLAHATHVR